MRWSRPATAALRLKMVAPAAALSAAICLGAAACGTTSAVAGGAYGTTSATAKAMNPAPATPGKAMLLVRKSNIGYVLATRSGQTIYWYSKDAQGSGKSACTGSCLASWPAVTGTPMAGAGVRLAGKLGKITRAGGVVQATYNGYPLYTYAEDMSPGEASGNGADGVWHVISGAVLSPSPASAAVASQRDFSSGGGAAPSQSATATPTGNGGGGGYGY
jgi:predicted lipoprotein with Yx(FWY)xxD motif